MQRRHGGATKPPSSTSEACARQESVWQLTCFARARAGCRARGWQESGGAAPKGAVLLELDERGADLPLQPLREPGAAQAPRVGEAFVRTTLCTSTAASRVCSARSRLQRLRPVTPGPRHNRRTACRSLHRLRQLFDWLCVARAAATGYLNREGQNWALGWCFLPGRPHLHTRTYMPRTPRDGRRPGNHIVPARCRSSSTSAGAESRLTGLRAAAAGAIKVAGAGPLHPR